MITLNVMYKKAIILLVTTLALQVVVYGQFGKSSSEEGATESTNTFGQSSLFRSKKAGGGPPDNPDGPISDYSYLLVGAVGLFVLRRKK